MGKMVILVLVGLVFCHPGSASACLHSGPRAWIHIDVDSGIITADAFDSEPALSPINYYVWKPRAGNPSELVFKDGSPFANCSQAACIKLAIPRIDGEYYLNLYIRDAQGRCDSCQAYFVVRNGRVKVPDVMKDHASWIDSAIVYGAVAQLWGERGFVEIEQKLDYLKELGFNTIWLWPPAATRAQGEEYGIVDYFSVDPEWGRADQLKSLVCAAHRRGLRVIIDFVPNHTSDEHPFFLDAMQYGIFSEFYDFYDREPNGAVTHYFDYVNLPNLNYENQCVRQLMTDAFAWWVRQFDVDGFRIDAAWGIMQRSKDFWPEFRRELKRIKPDLLLLAEAPATDPNYFDHGFDAAYDWRGGLGQWAWKDVFEDVNNVQARLVPVLTNDCKGFDPCGLVFRFVNNNDTGQRFIKRHGPGLAKLAAALEFTLPGLPLVFAGDEIGADYEPYSELEGIRWQDCCDLLPWYRNLIALRNQLPALRSPSIIMLSVKPASMIAYIRPDTDANSVLVLLNFGKAADAKIIAAAALMRNFDHGAVDMINQRRAFQLKPVKAVVTVPMDSHSVRILVPPKQRKQ